MIYFLATAMIEEEETGKRFSSPNKNDGGPLPCNTNLSNLKVFPPDRN